MNLLDFVEQAYEDLMSHPDIVAKGRKGGHFCLLSALSEGSQKQQLQQGFLEHARRVPVPAGSLFVWSSRVLHQGATTDTTHTDTDTDTDTTDT